MRSTRYFLFIITILIGLVVGILYGWVIRPGDSRNLPLSSLSYDYQTDYVLMTAEAFTRNAHLGEAVRRLGLLDDRSPDLVVAGAILTARELGYANADLDMLNRLQEALRQQITPAPAAPGSATEKKP